MIKELSKIRKKIDRLDLSLTKLLKKRSSLIEEARDLKKDCYPKIRFARETLMAYEIAKKDFGAYSSESMQAVWRELISSSLQIEGDLNIEVLGKANDYDALWIETRDHFGSYTNIKQNPSMESIIKNIAENVTTIGVLPFLKEGYNWWDYLVDYPEIKVQLTLPFLPLKTNFKHENGVVISKALVEKSVEDTSLFLVKVKSFKPLSNVKVLHSKEDSHLILVNGFCKDLNLVSKFVNIPVEDIFYLGAYPKPMFN